MTDLRGDVVRCVAHGEVAAARSGARPSEPLVSVGLPVRNGGPRLRAAIASVLEQDYANIEILVGDNASDEATQSTLAALASADPRVRLRRHERPVSAVRNFAGCFLESRGEYFCWAADDDLRSGDFVSTLVRALQDAPSAVLAFPDLCLMEADGGIESAVATDHDFETMGLPLIKRLEKQAHTSPYHIYGLIRAAALTGYPWLEPDVAPDWPLMAWLASRGTFLYCPGPVFYYTNLVRSEEEKAQSNAFRQPRRFQSLRLAWCCADSAASAAGPGRHPGRAYLFLKYFLWHGRGWKHLLYSRSPQVLRRAWHLVAGRPTRARL